MTLNLQNSWLWIIAIWIVRVKFCHFVFQSKMSPQPTHSECVFVKPDAETLKRCLASGHFKWFVFPSPNKNATSHQVQNGAIPNWDPNTQTNHQWEEVWSAGFPVLTMFMLTKDQLCSSPLSSICTSPLAWLLTLAYFPPRPQNWNHHSSVPPPVGRSCNSPAAPSFSPLLSVLMKRQVLNDNVEELEEKRRQWRKTRRATPFVLIESFLFLLLVN